MSFRPAKDGDEESEPSPFVLTALDKLKELAQHSLVGTAEVSALAGILGKTLECHEITVAAKMDTARVHLAAFAARIAEITAKTYNLDNYNSKMVLDSGMTSSFTAARTSLDSFEIAAKMPDTEGAKDLWEKLDVEKNLTSAKAAMREYTVKLESLEWSPQLDSCASFLKSLLPTEPWQEFVLKSPDIAKIQAMISSPSTVAIGTAVQKMQSLVTNLKAFCTSSGLSYAKDMGSIFETVEESCSEVVLSLSLCLSALLLPFLQ